MAKREGEALLLSVRRTGENGLLAEIFSREHGRIAGLCRRLDGLMAGDSVRFVHTRRLEGQLGSLTLEVQTSRAALMMTEPTAPLMAGYLAELAHTALPEDHAYPAVFAAMQQVWQGASPWWQRLAALERTVLEATGYGISLAEDAVPCAAGGALCYVSPRSGRAVSAVTASGYEDRLLPLPHIWGGPVADAATDAVHALRLTAAFLAKLLHGKDLTSRQRLVDHVLAHTKVPV